MRPGKPMICDLCEYYQPGVDPENDRDKPVCRAFPEGIPDEILLGGYDHREPLDDESITFKKAEGVSDEDVEAWEQAVLEAEKQEMLGMTEEFGLTE